VIKSADPGDPFEQWKSAKSDEAPLRSGDDPRALANIAQWREYLPDDCVEAMIKDGWHRRV
jgi:hypothetical protein